MLVQLGNLLVLVHWDNHYEMEHLGSHCLIVHCNCYFHLDNLKFITVVKSFRTVFMIKHATYLDFLEPEQQQSLSKIQQFPLELVEELEGGHPVKI